MMKSGSEVFKCKHDFAQYCSERRSGSGWPLPRVLDRFTVGDSLFLVEALPEDGWNTLETNAPPDPIAWTLAFYKSLELIGAHGNPNLETVCWRGSEVLLCRTTFPHLGGDSAKDDPAWVRQVVEAAFQADINAILKRSDLSLELRQKLEPLAPVVVTPAPLPPAAPDQPVLTNVPEKPTEAAQPMAAYQGGSSTVPQVAKPTPPPSRLLWGLTLVLLCGVSVLAVWLWAHRNPPAAPQSQNTGVTVQPTLTPTPSPIMQTTPTTPSEPERVQIRYFNLTPQEIKPGQEVVMSWDVAHVQQVKVSGLGPEPLVLPPFGTRSIAVPAGAEQVVLEAQGEGAGNSASAVRSLHLLPLPTPEPTLVAAASPTPVASTSRPPVRPWVSGGSDQDVHIDPKVQITSGPVTTPVVEEAHDAPVPRGTAVTSSSGYSGPHEGFLLWKGEIEKNGIITIDGNTASPGTINSELPGVPVKINLDTNNYAMVEQPSRDNGWKRMRIRSRNKQSSIILKWELKQ